MFAVVLWLGNAAYLYLSVSFIQMLKVRLTQDVCRAGGWWWPFTAHGSKSAWQLLPSG